MIPKLSLLIIIGIFISNFVQHMKTTSFEEDVTISVKQKEKLDKFRELVKDRLPHKYMKSEIYLIKWLRAKKFNIIKAEKFLMDNIKWRMENNIDTILDEDWTHFESVYRFGLEGCDKEGRPVVSVPVGDWDVRKAVISGQTIKLMRYFDKLFEEISVIIRKSQDHGYNMTQYNFIFQMQNYNSVLQGCPLCVPVYIHFFQSYENHYPLSVHKTTLVNVPDIYLTLWAVLKPLLSNDSLSTIKLYGRNSKFWKPALLKDIDPKQLTKEFGGLKDYPLELEELRAKGGYFQCDKYSFKEN